MTRTQTYLLYPSPCWLPIHSTTIHWALGNAAILILEPRQSRKLAVAGQRQLRVKGQPGKVRASECGLGGHHSQPSHWLGKGTSAGIFAVRRAKFRKFSVFALNGKAMMSEAVQGCPSSQEGWLGDNSSLCPLLFPNIGLLLFRTESEFGQNPDIRMSSNILTAAIPGLRTYGTRDTGLGTL